MNIKKRINKLESLQEQDFLPTEFLFKGLDGLLRDSEQREVQESDYDPEKTNLIIFEIIDGRRHEAETAN